MKLVRIISWALVGVLSLVMALLLFRGFEETSNGDNLVYGGDFQLVNTRGEPFTDDDLAGRPYAIFFGFTHCPDVCPTTLAEMNAWISELGPDADRMQFLFTTVDPERDTPEILASYISSFDDRIIGLTGEQQKLESMLNAYKVYYKKVPLDGGGYTMDHTASVILIDESGDFFGTIAYGESMETAVAKLERLVGRTG